MCLFSRRQRHLKSQSVEHCKLNEQRSDLVSTLVDQLMLLTKSIVSGTWVNGMGYLKIIALLIN